MAKSGVSVTNVQPGKHTAYVQQPVTDKSARATGLNTFAQGLNVAGTIAGSYADHKAKKEAEELGTSIEADITEYDQSNISGPIAAINNINSQIDPASGAAYADPNNWSAPADIAQPLVSELNNQMNLLTEAKKQGGMSSYELYERVNAKVRDAVHKNPYYTAELMNAARNTLSLNNVQKMVAFNDKYYDAVTAQSTARKKKNYSHALDKGLNLPLDKDGNVDDSQLQKDIIEYQKYQSSITQLEQYSNYNKAQIAEKISSGEAGSLINNMTHLIHEDLLTYLKTGLNNKTIKPENLKNEIQTYINTRKNVIKQQPSYSAIYANSDGRALMDNAFTLLDNMGVNLISQSTGENFNEHVETKLNIHKSSVLLNLAENGITTDTVELSKNLSDVWVNFNKVSSVGGWEKEERTAFQKDLTMIKNIVVGSQLNNLEALQNTLQNATPGSIGERTAQSFLNSYKSEEDALLTPNPDTNKSKLDELLESSKNWLKKAETTGIISSDKEDTPEVINMKDLQNNGYQYYMQAIDNITDTSEEAATKKFTLQANLLNGLAKHNPDHLYLSDNNITNFNNKLPTYLNKLKERLSFYIKDPATEDARINRLPNGNLALQGIPINQGIGQKVQNVVSQMNNSWLAYANVNKIPKNVQNANEFFTEYFKDELEEMAGVKLYGEQDQPNIEDSERLKMDSEIIELDDPTSGIFDVNQYSTAAVKGPTKDWKFIADRIKSDSKFLKLADGISEKLNVQRNNYLNMIQAISNVESYGGDYGAVGTNSKGVEMWGKYQFAPKTRNEISKKLGYKRMPSKKTFLNSPLMQEKFYTVYAAQIDRHLKSNSPKYNAMTSLQRLPYIAAGQFGMGNLVKYLEGGERVRDSKGTEIGIFIKAYHDYLSTLPNYGDQYSDVMEGEQLVNMRKVLEGKITGEKAEEVRTNFLEEFSSEALEQLKKEIGNDKSELSTEPNNPELYDFSKVKPKMFNVHEGDRIEALVNGLKKGESDNQLMKYLSDEFEPSVIEKIKKELKRN